MSSRPAFRPARALIYNLLAIALVMITGGVALAYGIDALGRKSHKPALLDDAGPLVTRTMAGRELVIPVSWFRYGDQESEGFASEISLSIDLPLGRTRGLETVELTLVPRSRARPSSGLLDGVYLHQFDAVDVDGAPGLVGKPMIATDGFEDETVWYDPLSADPFVAKCIEPLAAREPSRCLRTVVLPSGIAVIYSFGSDALASWREFDAAAAPWLGRMGAL